MFDATSEQFRKQIIDLSNQISVFRRVTVARNQDLLDEEERFNNQISSVQGNKTNIENIHFLYTKEQKEHISRDIKNELLYLNVIGKTYNDARARLVELAKRIKTVEDKEERKSIKDELLVILPFVEMYEEYFKGLKSMQAALTGYEHSNDRYVDFIKGNVDIFKDVKTIATEAKSALKEKPIEFDINITNENISIMSSYDNIKLEKPELFDLDSVTKEDIDYFFINYIENVSKNLNMSYDELVKKPFNVKINGKEIKNINEDTFADTVIAYALNQKKAKKDEEVKQKEQEAEIAAAVPDKPAEKDIEPPRRAKRVPKASFDAPSETKLIEKEDGKILNIDRILADLTKGLDLEKGDDWKFTASNIRVNQNFKNKVCTGNKLYNIVALAPSVISYSFQLIHKGIGKVAYNKKIDARVKQLQDRLRNLSEDELTLLYEQYKGGNLKNYNKMPIVNTMIQARINGWIKKKTKKITSRMVSIYNTILKDFKRMTEITKIYEDSKKESEAEAMSLMEEYQALIYGKAALIKEYLDLSKEKLDYEVGGAKGYSESIRAFKTGMSQAGFRFRKIPKENDEINEAQARAYEEELKGVANNDDLMALGGFIKREKILTDNSLYEDTLLMQKEVGLRSHNPVMKPLNYEKDPFVSDLMRTVVLVASGINLYNTIQRANELDNLKDLTEQQKQLIHEQQEQIGKLSEDVKYAKGLSTEISDKSGAVIDSRIAQINEANLAHTNTLERAVLDQTNWHSTGAEYKALDDAAHETYNNLYQASQAEINTIADGVANGTMSHADAMAKLTELSKSMEDQFVTNYKGVYDTVTKYATDHPQFDLTAPTEGLDKVISTSPNISVGNEAVDQAFKLAQEINRIEGVTLSEVEALANNLSKIEAATGVVPTQSMIPGLFNSLSAAALAIGVKNRMVKYNAYGYFDELEDMDNITEEDIKNYERITGTNAPEESETEEKGRTK